VPSSKAIDAFNPIYENLIGLYDDLMHDTIPL